MGNLFGYAASTLKNYLDHGGYLNLERFCDSISSKLGMTINLRRSGSPGYGDYGVIIQMMPIKNNESNFREIEIGVNAFEDEEIFRILIYRLGESVHSRENRFPATLAIEPNESPPFCIKLFQELVESELIAFHFDVFG